MAEDLQSLALEKAELLSSRLKELVSLGQNYVQTQFGVDLGLKPELYPTWVILSTTAVGLLLLLCVSWAVVCLSVGKKRQTPVNKSSEEPCKAEIINHKQEEHKKRSKKKTAEKKTQSNGQPVVVAQDQVKEIVAVPKISPQIKAVKVHEVQAPVQVKKNKKKNKPDVKPTQQSSTNDGKEPDDGVWETKVSNREKRQQRRKEKGSEDSGSSGGVEAPKTHVEAPVATAASKKNRGNRENQHSRTTTKGEAASGAVSWREETSVNGSSWVDKSLKVTGQMGPLEGKKWSHVPAAAHYRPQSDPQAWVQESQAAWSSVDGPIKTTSFSVLGLGTKDPLSNPSQLQWTKRPVVDDEWSGFNGMAAADPSSDWNAPVEHWGNYEEPPVLVAAASLQKDQAVPSKVSENEKNIEDPSGGAEKSKKKRKKKKKPDEESASDSQMLSTAPVISAATKTQELPVLPSNVKNTSTSSSQKKSEPPAEPQKSSQKKKVRRET